MSKSSFSEEIIQGISKVIKNNKAQLHEPVFEGNEWNYVRECIDSTFVSSVGKFVDRFEFDLAEYTGAKYAVAVMNGTSALEIALKLAGVFPNDEVLIPSLTFVATANAVSYCSAIPHFIDSEERTLGIDIYKLSEYLDTNVKIVNRISINKNSGRPIRAIVPMHTFGHPCNLDELVNLANKYNIAIVEDAAEALGSYYKGKHVGTFGLFGTLSFNGNKTITTGGGGAILTNNEELAKKAKHLTTTAKVKHSWEFIHDQVGYNYRMPNINAALGCAQLENITNTLKRKRQLFNKYEKAFHNITGANLVKEPNESKSNYWLQTILLDNSHKNFRDDILKATNKKGIMTRPAWTLMHLLDPYKHFPKMNLSQSINLSKRLINIPSSSNLIQS